MVMLLSEVSAPSNRSNHNSVISVLLLVLAGFKTVREHQASSSSFDKLRFSGS